MQSQTCSWGSWNRMMYSDSQRLETAILSGNSRQFVSENIFKSTLCPFWVFLMD